MGKKQKDRKGGERRGKRNLEKKEKKMRRERERWKEEINWLTEEKIAKYEVKVCGGGLWRGPWKMEAGGVETGQVTALVVGLCQNQR